MSALLSSVNSYIFAVCVVKMPVGPRVTKEEFMNALGLSPQDEPYYRAMRVSIHTIFTSTPPRLPPKLLTKMNNKKKKGRSNPHLQPHEPRPQQPPRQRAHRRRHHPALLLAPYPSRAPALGHRRDLAHQLARHPAVLQPRRDQWRVWAQLGRRLVAV